MVTTKRSTTRTITTSIRSSNNGQQTNGAIKTAVPPAWVAILGGVVVAVVGVRLNTWMVSIAEQQQQAAWRDYYQVETVPHFVQPDDVTTAPSQLYADLHNASLWRACDKITKGATRFWLLHKTESPKNVFEQMAVKMYRNTPYWDEAAAFEYWCNILEVEEEMDTKREPLQGVELHWHTDRDEDILERERRFVVPLRGAVYYGFPQFDGGQFHIINSVPYHQRPSSEAAVQPAPTDECDSNTHFCITNPSHFGTNDSALYVTVEPNMLLMANVTYFHKVTPLLSGKRFSLAVNANHWLPYDDDDSETTEDRQRLSLTNDELLQVASSRDVFPKRKRTIGLTGN